MTTPNLPMPFAVVSSPVAGSYQMASIDLTTGTVMIRVIWDGGEPIRARVERIIGGQTRAMEYVTIIPSAPVGKSRSSAPIEVAVGEEPTLLRLQSTAPISQETVSAGARCGITVIPMYTL